MNVCKECNWGSCKPDMRKCEGLDEDLALMLGDTADNYGDGLLVSIEFERERQLLIQEGLDRQVEQENQHDDPDRVSQRGLPPCKRVKRTP